jgi:peptidoglycan/LPS O-acetylase OafA/YrhL
MPPPSPLSRRAITLAPAGGRLRELDALRAIAVLVVMFYHYGTRFDSLYGHATPWPVSTSLGYYGVHLFFMISGFVILMTAERSASVGVFLRNRAARLFPAFWAGCALSYAAVQLFGLPDRAVSIKDALLNLTMVPSLLGAEMIDGVYWSLRVEWFFYALVAALIGFRQLKWAWLVLTVLTALDACGVRIQYFNLFLVGMIAYNSMRSRLQWWHALGLGVAALDAWVRYDPQVFALLVGFAALLFACTRWPMPWLANPVLVFLGTISYGLYLVHQNIGYITMRELYERGASTPLAVGGAFAVAVVLATAVTFLVERPANRWLRAHVKKA